MKTHRFTCSLDKFSKLISTYLVLFGIALLIIPPLLNSQETDNGYLALMAIGGFLLLLTLSSYLFSPTSYGLSREGLTIERKWKSKLIRFDDILQIRKPEEKELQWPVRTLGNGGLFGYTGRYYAKHIGSMIWFCSRRDRQVIIERKFALPVVISPDEPERLVWAWGELKRPVSANE